MASWPSYLSWESPYLGKQFSYMHWNRAQGSESSQSCHRNNITLLIPSTWSNRYYRKVWVGIGYRLFYRGESSPHLGFHTKVYHTLLYQQVLDHWLYWKHTAPDYIWETNHILIPCSVDWMKKSGRQQKSMIKLLHKPSGSSLRNHQLIGIGIPIIKLSWSSDHLRFIMGTPMPVRQ